MRWQLSLFRGTSSFVTRFVLVSCMSAALMMLSGCSNLTEMLGGPGADTKHEPPSVPDDPSTKAQRPCPQGSQGQSAQDCGKSADTH
jgi:hypothetical protein